MGDVLPARAKGRSGSSNKALLIVDDEPDLLVSTRSLFEATFEGLEVLTAASAEEGLAILHERRPDVIISDYRMPGMDGLQFLGEAERLYPDVPRIMITAFAEPTLAVEAARRAGVVLLIAKPFDLQYFVDIVGSALRTRPGIALG
jgi:DNA-binding NtrC family response regulator